MGRTKSQDQSARRLYHLSHCIMRMRHRYGLEMDGEDYDTFCRAFRDGGVTNVRNDDMGHREGWVKFKGTWVCLSFNIGTGLVGTVMPCPPSMPGDVPAPATPILSRNEEINEKAKKVAEQLLHQAIRAGRAPKWLKGPLPPPGEPPESISTRRDISWFKEWIRLAGGILARGEPRAEALVILDALVGLPKAIRPSARPEEANHLMQERMAERRAWLNTDWEVAKNVRQAVD